MSTRQKKEKPVLRKMLVVDDERETTLLLTHFFSQKHYDVLSAFNGKEAINIVKTHRPPIVLLDIKMEDINGLEVLKRIKEIDKNIKVLMLTALDDEETITEAKKLGADDYIPKPLSIEHLEGVVLSKLADLHI